MNKQITTLLISTNSEVIFSVELNGKVSQWLSNLILEIIHTCSTKVICVFAMLIASDTILVTAVYL